MAENLRLRVVAVGVGIRRAVGTGGDEEGFLVVTVVLLVEHVGKARIEVSSVGVFVGNKVGRRVVSHFQVALACLFIRQVVGCALNVSTAKQAKSRLLRYTGIFFSRPGSRQVLYGIFQVGNDGGIDFGHGATRRIEVYIAQRGVIQRQRDIAKLLYQHIIIERAKATGLRNGLRDLLRSSIGHILGTLHHGIARVNRIVSELPYFLHIGVVSVHVHIIMILLQAGTILRSLPQVCSGFAQRHIVATLIESVNQRRVAFVHQALVIFILFQVFITGHFVRIVFIQVACRE